MSEYRTVIEWNREEADHVSGRCGRGHCRGFDGEIEVPACAYRHGAPMRLSVALDPEEAFIASLSSCHMLLFLSLASRREFLVENYYDEAVGILTRDASGRLAVTCVTLHPEARFGSEHRPTDKALSAMHCEAHEHCFIARSVKAEVRCEPTAISVPQFQQLRRSISLGCKP